MYAKSFDMASAKLVFDEMPNRNLVCWNALIVGYLHNALYKEAILAFLELLMIGPSIRPDQVSFSSALSACANSRELNLGQGTHNLAVKSGLEPLAYVKNSLIDMYTKCGCFNTAHELFDEMLEKDVVTWNIMATGFVQSERFEEAIGLFLAMRRHHPQPDEASFSTVLNAAANLVEMLVGTEIHCQVLKFGFPLNRSITSSLITMYSKCGSLEYAERVFAEVKKFHNVVSWTAMIAALQLHGHGNQVLQLFDEMLESGINPDYITFVCVLSACSHNGLVERGFKYFYSMSREHSLIPTGEHYACIVDMLGRAGRLDEAKQFINEMPLQPDVSVWGALLGACRNYQNLELGREVAHKLFEIEPLNPGNYILLSNLYASHGRMEEADEVRSLMGINGVKKVTSYSWIEVRRKTFVFTAHDLSHEKTREIYEMLRKMEELVKEKGYVADIRFAVNHVEGYKEYGLWRHSERLALAFGLMCFPEGGVIRVMKNLRTCGDCHTVMKLLSGILQREIVLRDTNRFHRFANGLCSCRDYW
ncbi:hypothetical protein HPP92_021595 [Vanilla planifolia]|uniref:DYW domain-containing protein n=1 Tax=Vanilla planifolia TaxID=51239 RepID=A0A835UHB8_VANPL|nr:hypothetical protein HPP92_021595 [Vanilla planifolia]